MTDFEFLQLESEILSKGEQISSTKWKYDKYTLIFGDSKMVKN